MNVYVTIGGGTFFDSCMRVLKVEIVSGSITSIYCADNLVYGESTKGFTGLSRTRGGYVATTEAEIFRFSDSFDLIDRFTFPFLNDVHHVIWSYFYNRYYVANTGLDTIEVFDDDFFHIESIGLIRPRDYFRAIRSTLFYSRQFFQKKEKSSFDLEDVRYKKLIHTVTLPNLQKVLWHMKLRRRALDFRYVLLRPHITHPNHVSDVRGELVVTLKNPGEVRSLRTGNVLVSGLQGPHDGFLKDDLFVLTESGTGSLLFAPDIASVSDLKLAKFKSVKVCDPKQGFLRGVEVTGDRFAVAAVSKRREVTDASPAWLAVVDIMRMKVVHRLTIPQEYGTNPFSVLS